MVLVLDSCKKSCIQTPIKGVILGRPDIVAAKCSFHISFCERQCRPYRLLNYSLNLNYCECYLFGLPLLDNRTLLPFFVTQKNVIWWVVVGPDAPVIRCLGDKIYPLKLLKIFYFCTSTRRTYSYVLSTVLWSHVDTILYWFRCDLLGWMVLLTTIEYNWDKLKVSHLNKSEVLSYAYSQLLL